MDRQRAAASVAGLVAGTCALATSYAAAMLLTIDAAPSSALVDEVASLVPESVRERTFGFLVGRDSPLLLVVVFGLLLLLAAWAGRLRLRSWWPPLVPWGVLWATCAVAAAFEGGALRSDVWVVLVGFVTSVLLLELLHLFARRDRDASTRTAVARPAARTGPRTAAGPQPAPSRRGFIVASSLLMLSATGLVAVSGALGRARRQVAESRLLLRIEGLTRGRVPARADLGVGGLDPWQTPVDDFFVHHGALTPPVIEPKQWTLRVHGLVARELNLDYQALLRRTLTETWTTLVCVRNEVGGDLVGNAWWSGVRTADLLAEAGFGREADCVVQTGADGWRCVTPLEAFAGEDALLALGMNGRPLAIEHGFPVRTIVPGLFGHVSATKWLVDLEVTRYDALGDEFPEEGWSLQAPVKTTSRIDVPTAGTSVPEGRLTVAGFAWAGAVGVAKVEVSLDGGPWEVATSGAGVDARTWVQWQHEFTVVAGEHTLVVRATDSDGATQSSVVRDVRPDGATGWHQIEFEAVAEQS